MGLCSDLPELLSRASGLQQPLRLFVIAPHEQTVLASAMQAQHLGIARVVLVGDERLIRQVADESSISLEKATILDVKDPMDSANKAAHLVGTGEGDMLMKGLLPTKSVAQAILDPANGLRTGNILSHVAIFRPPKLDRLLFMTDSGINIAPNFSRKLQIVRNAVNAARHLGLERPRVAMIAAIERLELPAMPTTLDAKIVERLATTGMFPDADIQGPLGLDNAVSELLAQRKGIKGPVAGRADIICVPDIESGNILYKTLTCFAGVEIAGTMMGAKVPVILPSRSDTTQTKLYCIALARIMAAGIQTGQPQIPTSSPSIA